MKKAITVLCVDDHSFLIEGLRARIEAEDDIEFVGQLSSAEDLVKESMRLEPDIVLLDVEMPGPDPFEALDDLKRRCPDTRAIMLTAYVRDHYIDAAFQAGAWGYLTKSDPTNVIVEGIRRVAAGETTFSVEVLQRSQPLPSGSRNEAATPRSKLSMLTDRELQILRLIAKGKSRVDIATELCRSPMTIDNHRKSIMKKLGINDRVELARFAIAEKLVEV